MISSAEKSEIIGAFNTLCASGLSGNFAARRLGISHSSIIRWRRELGLPSGLDLFFERFIRPTRECHRAIAESFGEAAR